VTAEDIAPRLAIVAGGGPLPRRVIASCRQRGRSLVVVGFEGQTDAETVPAEPPHLWSRLGAAGALVDHLAELSVREICLVGTIRRPSLAELRPDWKTAKLLGRIGLAAGGDDAVLQAIGRVLAERGFRLVAPQELMDDLLAPDPGALGMIEPDADARADIDRALAVARAIGALDVGQGAVVQQGLVLAVEAAEGTDAMLARCAGLARPGPGGVLVKARKPQQDDRLDLPTIGTTTVEGAAAAGLRGIAVEAGGALIADADAVRAAADRHGLFVVVLPAGERESVTARTASGNPAPRADTAS